MGQLYHGHIQSSREHVNVMTYSAANLNNYYPPVSTRPKSQSLQDYLQASVYATLVAIGVGWLDRIDTVTIREDVTTRGGYLYSVWSDDNAS